MGKRRMGSELYRIKLDKGTVYQTQKGGTYYFRYQVNRERKCATFDLQRTIRLQRRRSADQLPQSGQRSGQLVS